MRSDEWRFIGLDNFAEMARDPHTPTIIWNTFYLVVATTVIPTVLGLGLAVLMETAVRGIGLIRTLFLLPIMTAPIVVALTWRAMFNNDAGWINYFLGLGGLPQPVWLGDPLLAMPAVIIADMWTGVPFQAILLLAALLGVPRELKDAAEVDGASTRTCVLARDAALDPARAAGRGRAADDGCVPQVRGHPDADHAAVPASPARPSTSTSTTRACSITASAMRRRSGS